MDLGLRDLRVIVTAGARRYRSRHRPRVRERRCAPCACATSTTRRSSGCARPIPRSPASVATSRTACDVDRFVASAVAALGGLDCLVNNAGIAGPTGRVDEIDPAEWDRCLAVDLTGQFNVVRRAVPHLRRSANASIMNVSSLAGRLGFALRTPYAAAKWGVIGFSRSLAIELGADRIRVNALLPGIVAGERQRRVLDAKAQARGVAFEEMERIAFASTSIKEYVTPEELADLVVYVASPRGRMISGQSLSVCGDTQMLG